MKLFSEKEGLCHMHLSDENEAIKALSIYKEFRTGRSNFVELKCIHVDEINQGHEIHLIRNLAEHLGNVRYSYVLYQAQED